MPGAEARPFKGGIKMKKMFCFLFVFFLIFSAANINLAVDVETEGKAITMTILYDNYFHQKGGEGLIPHWGFACLIEGTEKTILFDTGTKSDVFLNNIKRSNVEPKKVESVVISHNHGDHTGGLLTFLGINPKVSVYIPVSASKEWAARIEKFKAKMIAVAQPLEICKGAWSTGEIQGPFNEQSLIVDTAKGLVVITGCAHPNIAKIVEKSKTLRNKKIYMVFGGFHLMRKSDVQVKEIIKKFKELGVQKVGATHCTGDKAIQLFKDAYGKNYVPMGVGRIIKIDN
ncbi:MAG: MBL fold metallo-hydrolase [Candidatus Aminicenantes bacterium]|nr:MBL fold metallo-hydrolase [Candidatus Aminicenantes bacterium]NIM83269.1 MBL fold metallo-hydrolase [Candidatus Aminicenantes bacterium]NIN22640.1 MBL fold metallo-hydrolase [Candidatus Aminicenantes bacterium]NIN46399.1 MBL fold metallo-hydrolase [Candidatus Aminicenantes bacterium]NIN89249.1 MBL fold metallo-hydrolase [Candidatus Aminicenantes bacterium]